MKQGSNAKLQKIVDGSGGGGGRHNGDNKNCKHNNNICNVFTVDLCTYLFDNSM